MTNGKRVSRRGFMKLGASTAGVAATGITGFPHIAWSQRQNSAFKTRVDAAEFANNPNHPILDAYRTAVTKMVARSQRNINDPIGWQAQAQIHQDRCTHNNWFFLPWHRAYLVAFEDICRQESGYPDFALPYWDWVKNPQLPPAFLSGPLLDTTRTFGANDRLTEGVFLPENFQRDVMDLPEFWRFGGEIRGMTAIAGYDWQKAGGEDGPALPPGVATESGSLESSPHNAVHGALGGNMGNFMSPLDPIFWLHHCNVDRAWTVWRSCARAANRPTMPASTLWQNYSFNFREKADFVTPGGQPRVFTVSGVQSVNKLGYSYGTAGDCRPVVVASGRASGRSAAPAAAPRPLATLDTDWRARSRSAPVAAPVRTSAPVSVAPAAKPVPAAAPGRAAGRSAAPSAGSFQLPADGQIPSRVVAILSDIVPPAESDTVLRVFVNNKAANAQTPPTDPSYVTTLSFFGHGPTAASATPAARAAGAPAAGGHAGHAGRKEHTMNIVVELTRALNAMKAAGRLQGNQVEIQLVAVNPKAGPGKDVAIRVGRVDVSGNRT